MIDDIEAMPLKKRPKTSAFQIFLDYDELQEFSETEEGKKISGSMNLDGPDFWGNKAREIRTLLYQRWKDCSFLGIENLPSWPEIVSHPDLSTLQDLEKRLEGAGGKEKKTRKKKESA